MLSINTNLSSLIVQSNLKLSTFGLNTAIERMTAGFKINHAKDNAANFSINTMISSKLSSYYVAQDNASMGLDMMACAMDSLDLISSHLSRIRDLAEQSAMVLMVKTLLKQYERRLMRVQMKFFSFMKLQIIMVSGFWVNLKSLNI